MAETLPVETPTLGDPGNPMQQVRRRRGPGVGGGPGGFGTCLGWTIPWGAPVTWLGERARSRSARRTGDWCGSGSTAPDQLPVHSGRRRERWSKAGLRPRRRCRNERTQS